jgi:hypothetical protein
MTLRGVGPDHIVLADVKGRRFYAIVLARHDRELEVAPIDRRVNYYRGEGARGDRHLANEPRQRGPRRRDEQAGRMTGPANGDDHADEFERLVVVRVEDTIELALTEQTGARYQSPPQSQEQAMALVRLVLGRVPDADGSLRWTAAIAGGRRVVTLSDEGNR